MTVHSRQEAWGQADAIFPTDYMIHDQISARNGYNVYYSTAEGVQAWISDLGNRLEVNLETGETVNIWIEEVPEFPEYALADSLKVIDEAIYQIDDNVLPELQKITGIDEARKKLHGAYTEIAKIIEAHYPDSKLIKDYCLDDHYNF